MIPTSACWEVTTVRLPDHVPLGQPFLGGIKMDHWLEMGLNSSKGEGASLKLGRIQLSLKKGVHSLSHIFVYQIHEIINHSEYTYGKIQQENTVFVNYKQ